MAHVFTVKVTKISDKENWCANRIGLEFRVVTSEQGNVLGYFKLIREEFKRVKKELKAEGDNMRSVIGLTINKDDCIVVNNK